MCLTNTVIIIINIGWLFAITALLSGCASIKPTAGFGDIEQVVGERTQQQLHWNQDRTEDSEVATLAQSILQRKMTAKDAVQIALLRNPSLQATFEALGIANADLMVAGLVESPNLQAGLGFPVGSAGARTAVDLSLSQNVMDLVQRTRRKRVAAAELEKTKLQVADAVLRLAGQVKATYYTYQGALQMLDFRKAELTAAEAAADLAQAQREAGNISTLDLGLQQAMYQTAIIELERSQAEGRAVREALARLMGLTGAEVDWSIVTKLPRLPRSDPALNEIESLALAQRLDLAASREGIEASRHAVALARSSWVPSLSIGVRGELDAEGNNTVGPIIGMGLPLLGHRKAALARAEARLRQTEKEAEALMPAIQSEARLAYNRLTAARRAAEFYRGSILPLQAHIVSESLKHYNYMLLGNYQLLLAKQNQITAQRDYINALRDYWIAYAELERVAGGSLNGGKK